MACVENDITYGEQTNPNDIVNNWTRFSYFARNVFPGTNVETGLQPDGTIIRSEILDHARMNKPGQGFYKVLAESALRAVKLCQPLRVPTTGYERWKELQLNFDAREMLEG